MKTIQAIVLLFLALQVRAQIEVKLPRETKLLDCQGIEFANAETLQAGQAVRLTDYYEGYFTASINGKSGYIYYPYLDGIEGLDSFKSEHQKANTGLKIETCRLQQMKKKYGEKAGILAYQGKPWIGMGAGIAIDLFGHPKSKNTTQTAGYKGEQWVYADRNLYFDNGVLTAIQESK